MLGCAGAAHMSSTVVHAEGRNRWVSFHHALNWLLTELFKHIGGLDDTALREAGYSSVQEIIVRQASEQAILPIIDFPLRGYPYQNRYPELAKVCAGEFRLPLGDYPVLAMIDACMIAQIRTGLWVRDDFAIDLFVLQTALIVLPPDTVFVSILDRFGHTGYFAGATLHAHYEGAQLSPMVEELLYVLIVIMGRYGATLSMRSRSALALSCVTEHLVDDVCFEAVLSEMACFRAPESIADVDAHRGAGAHTEAARDRGWPNVVVLTEEAGAVLPSAEAILDQALHLVMLALVERPAEFSCLAVRERFERDKMLVDVACTLEHHAMYRTYRARVAWVLGEMENHQFEGGEKRAVAKARQKAGKYNFTKILTCSDRDAMHTHSKSVLVWDQIGANDRRLLSQTSALEQKEVEELSLRAQVDELIQSCNQHLRALEQARTALQVSSSRAEEVHVQYDRRASRSARSRWMLENNTRTEPLEVRKYNTYEKA
ncbi:hypothetical protein DFH08DRAFT_987929 [Mycena albidolilacea]|uniref:Uncharacterized protein n=1 Tax=Mycena albidolilacea TaxID=1033008 RepID=A0AAD7EVK4_9AGAR|nr:hypothetical protein DFH08DRAFT_987929 [Mycena albidolilacea]